MIENITKITCFQTTKILSDSIDGYSNSVELEQLTQHVKSCEYCKIAYVQFSTIFEQIASILKNK